MPRVAHVLDEATKIVFAAFLGLKKEWEKQLGDNLLLYL